MTFPYPSKDEYEQCVKREAEAYLDQLAAYAAAADVTWDQLIISSHATAPTIVETAKHCKSDLIVMGSHGRGGVGQLLLGSVTNKVLAACHIPVLVHRGGKKLARRHTPVAKRTAGSHALVI
jgi:nucleotide-binding universal stress UspA family protein